MGTGTKRVFAQPGQGNAFGGRRKRQRPAVTFEEALNYVYEVHEALKDADKEKFDDFVQLMQDYKTNFTGYREVMDRVLDLFEPGYPHLILGFNKFLPRGYRFIVWLGMVMMY